MAVRVVFSTYQSVPVVAKGSQGLPPFDLGVFDEAHKTAGLAGGTFARALDDARLRIRKRLFFTATPRHFDIRHRDREGDFTVVSMDDAAVYGPRAYAQTFADTVALGIICDYRVVVVVSTPRKWTALPCVTLLPERIERLEALGVVWEPHHATWEQRFSRASGHHDTAAQADMPWWFRGQNRARSRTCSVSQSTPAASRDRKMTWQSRLALCFASGFAARSLASSKDPVCPCRATDPTRE